MLRHNLQNGFETNIFGPAPSPKIRSLLDMAEDFMINTKDLSHGIDHINNLLKNVNRFFKSSGDKFSIDKEILLLAIYWHDVWKSQNKPTLWNYLFHQLYEGLGSMFMFKKHARLVDLSPNITRAVSYAIRKHSAVQIRPAKTLEAQLLWDIDTLDIWNVERVKGLFKHLKWTNISVFDSYIIYMKKMGFHLNFEWTRNEVKKKRPLFFEAMAQFRENLVHRSIHSKPLFVQPQALSTHLSNFRSVSTLPDIEDQS